MWICVCFLFPSKMWLIVYRLLQRHRCRRRTGSGRLQSADIELLFLLLFSFCDVYMTSGFHIAFWPVAYRKPHFFCFWTVYRGLSWISPINCAYRQLPCRSGFRTFLIFDLVRCCFCSFLTCKWGLLLCIAINMTSDVLLDLTFYWNFDGNVFFCKSCHWNFFFLAVNWVLRWSLTCFSISFWTFFLHRCDVKTVHGQI